MKKIPTVYQRDANDMSSVTDEVNPKCQWVIDGEGVATRKYDGTCVMLDSSGKWWARREVKAGRPIPPNFQEEDFDPNTGKRQGWEPMGQSSFAKPHAEAVSDGLQPGTYELCGPKINGNPEGYENHRLIAHATAEVVQVVGGIREFVAALDYEGLVWHHPDGRMAKLKARDFKRKEDSK